MTRRRMVLAAALAAGTVVLGASAVVAEAPVGDVGPHAHYVVTAGGDRVRVGPDACANGRSEAFDQFHFNGHRGVPGDLGVIVGGGCPAP